MVNNRKVKATINTIVEKIKKYYKPDKIILFGSYVYGNPTDESDIDLLIIKNTSKRLVKRCVKIREIIYDQKRRVPVSPLVFTPKEIETSLKNGDDYIEEIITRGEILYEKR